MGVGRIFNPKIYVADFGPLNRVFEHENVANIKNLQLDFPKMRRVGVKVADLPVVFF